MCRLILFISHQSGKKGAHLNLAIQKQLRQEPQIICNTIENLRIELRRPNLNGKEDVFVALADTKERLNQLSELTSIVEGKRLVLVLPDSDKATLSKGGKLWPRFTTRVDSNYDDLCAVLGKMTGTELSDKSDTQKNQGGEGG